MLCKMEDTFGPKTNTLLEDIIYAVISVTNDDIIVDELYKCFKLPKKEFLDIAEAVKDGYKKPKINLKLKTLKLRNVQNLTDGGHGVICLLKVGEQKHKIDENNLKMMWDVDKMFDIENLWNQKIDVEIWELQERDQKLSLGRVWLRSLDTFSKKIRSNLRSQNLTSLNSFIPSEDGNVSPCKANEQLRCEAKSNSTQGSNIRVNDDRTEKDKRRDTIHGLEPSWVVNAFATLRKPIQKKSLVDNAGAEICEGRYVDIRSPIPTGQETLRNSYRSWRMKSEKSFFSKYDSRFGYKFGSQSDKKDFNKGDIKTKPEVQVKRQLFREFLNPSSPILEDESSPNTNVKSIHEVRSMPKLHTIADFVPININDDSMDDKIKTLDDNLQQGIAKPRVFPSLSSTSLKLSAKNDFQLWKRMSLSLRDKGFTSPTFETKPFSYEQNERICDASSSRHLISKCSKGSFDEGKEEEDEYNMSTIKVKTGTSSISLKDSFQKMECSQWTIEVEESILIPSAQSRASRSLKPTTVSVTMELCPQFSASSVPALTVLVFCLKHFLSLQNSTEITANADKGMGMKLPVNKNAKIILKSLVFIYNVSEAQLSLACWLVLTQGHYLQLSSLEAASICDMIRNKTCADEGSPVGDEHSKKVKKLYGFCGHVHPKYYYHWLAKVEAAVSASSYTENEEKAIFSCIEYYMEFLGQQFRRIHAAFPVDHASHLAFGLRCVHLLCQWKGLQTIALKTGKEIERSWPKTQIIDAVLIHTKNWVDALVYETTNGKMDNTSVSLSTSDTHINGTSNSTSISPNSFLIQAIMNGEKAMLAVNDFIVLGEKVYEINFNSELHESYLQVIWPTITSALLTLLEPIQYALQAKEYKAVINAEIESLQDLHISLWILLLQMSKLQRFQISREKQSYSMILPESFSEIFFLLSRLWLHICTFRAKETAALECQTDDLSVTDAEDGLSSSARELTDLINVIQEKLCRFSFPPIKKFKENLALFLEEGIVSVVETYQDQICGIALKTTATTTTNTLTPQMCIAVNNVHRVCLEAESLVASLSSSKESDTKLITSLRTQTKEASLFLFSKSLPRLQAWITNALSSKENEDFLLDWIKSILDPIIADHSSQTKVSPILLRHFWDYVFTMVKEKQKMVTQPKDFRILGNFMEKFYYLFKITLRVALHNQSEIEFEEFMKAIHLKGSSTSDVIQMYYADRLKEQDALSTGRKPMVINAYFNKDKGLKVEVFMCPCVDLTPKDKVNSSPNTNGDPKHNSRVHKRKSSTNGVKTTKDFLLFPKEFRVTAQVKRKASCVIGSLAKSSSVNFYVKANPVPADSFKKVSGKKTKSTQRNPPVFEDQLSFCIKPTDEGVLKGGFLILRLKYSTISSSMVDSEAILPLQDIPVLAPDEKRGNKHTYLNLSAPSCVQDYKTLQELTLRKQDKEAISFLSRLQRSYWVPQAP